jgi:hypothetical protein
VATAAQCSRSLTNIVEQTGGSRVPFVDLAGGQVERHLPWRLFQRPKAMLPSVRCA